MSDWINTNGNPPRQFPSNQKLELKWEDESITSGVLRDDFDSWSHVIAYRLIDSEPPQQYAYVGGKKRCLTPIERVLAERGQRYGTFVCHAEASQALKKVIKSQMGDDKWNGLNFDQREALEMIAHKIARIINGDPNYADSWVDIAGYAKLVADRLEGTAR